MPRGKKRGALRGGTRGRPRGSKSGGGASSQNTEASVNSTKKSWAPSHSIITPALGTDDVIFCPNYDFFQEVVVEEDAVDINVENSRSNSPASLMNDAHSTENSVSSFAMSEAHSKYYTREDLTPSEVLPDNLFTENDEDMKPINLDLTSNMDMSVNLNDGPGFSMSSLFPIKEEPRDEEPARLPEGGVEEEKKKATRRRIKQELVAEAPPTKIQIMSLYEEQLLHRQLRQLAEKNVLDPQQRRLYRKLSLRNTKRSVGQEPFNFDRLVARLLGKEWHCPISQSEVKVVGISNVLDRFQKGGLSSSVSRSRLNISFRSRLLGSDESCVPQPVISPYTGRALKPFIRRDHESRPLKLRLLEEIRSKCVSPEIRNSPSKSIDYVYVQPHHVPAVNAICREFFWAGIDVSECLEYPDFSCVVLYGHVVVAFAFMVPDVSYNEAYVSYLFTHPEWRGAGIAKFMLYHLIQSCMGKDVTLHVSATNPAVNLYHKFGFKVQEFVGDFYDKYLPADSTQCKHAFFMRLTR